MRYGGSVTSRSVGHGYAVGLAVVEVDVVGAYGGGGYELARGAVEQPGVTSCACARYQRVGVT